MGQRRQRERGKQAQGLEHASKQVVAWWNAAGGVGRSQSFQGRLGNVQDLGLGPKHHGSHGRFYTQE